MGLQGNRASLSPEVGLGGVCPWVGVASRTAHHPPHTVGRLGPRAARLCGWGPPRAPSCGLSVCLGCTSPPLELPVHPSCARQAHGSSLAPSSEHRLTRGILSTLPRGKPKGGRAGGLPHRATAAPRRCLRDTGLVLLAALVEGSPGQALPI